MVIETPENAEFIKIAEKDSIIWDSVELIEMNPNVSYRIISGKERTVRIFLNRLKRASKIQCNYIWYPKD